MISKYLDKNNLHHAYLIEGERDLIAGEIMEFLKESGVKTIGSPDFIRMDLDSFKIEDARNLKTYSGEKSFSSEQTGKKIFLISVNNFLLEAQNSLLKMLEEPIENTHFFLIVPDVNVLLKTFVSRFYVISAKKELGEKTKEAEEFIAMPLRNRIDFIKELLIEEDKEDEDGNGIIVLNSARVKALKFLNALESVLEKKLVKNKSLKTNLNHFFKVRKFLRMPGSSAKTLMESVALVVPEKI